MKKPELKKPTCANFSSGPCKKRPNWNVDNFELSVLGRSHRSKLGKQRLAEVINLSKEILNIPNDWLVGIMPGSDTGAFEAAIWSMLGERNVDVFVWESFSKGWATDITNELNIDANVFSADYGLLPDLSQANFDNDVVFVWNGTTSGVKLPNADWIADDRAGLTFCDATSAVFAMDIAWSKLDVVTWSWQKSLGGEGAHGMIALSPRAQQRLQNFEPARPIPKIFKLAKNKKLINGIFAGSTINTPSMLATEDAIDGLVWLKSIGGLSAGISRAKKNFSIIKSWVDSRDWITLLAKDMNFASETSVCLEFTGSLFSNFNDEEKVDFVNNFCKILEQEEVAFDIKGYRDAPPSIRIWCGTTIEAEDIELLCPWLDYAFAKLTS